MGQTCTVELPLRFTLFCVGASGICVCAWMEWGHCNWTWGRERGRGGEGMEGGWLHFRNGFVFKYKSRWKTNKINTTDEWTTRKRKKSIDPFTPIRTRFVCVSVYVRGWAGAWEWGDMRVFVCVVLCECEYKDRSQRWFEIWFGESGFHFCVCTYISNGLGKLQTIAMWRRGQGFLNIKQVWWCVKVWDVQSMLYVLRVWVDEAMGEMNVKEGGKCVCVCVRERGGREWMDGWMDGVKRWWMEKKKTKKKKEMESDDGRERTKERERERETHTHTKETDWLTWNMFVARFGFSLQQTVIALRLNTKSNLTSWIAWTEECVVGWMCTTIIPSLNGLF